MRRMKSSPICMFICRRVRLTVPVRAMVSGRSLVSSIVLSTRSSKRDVCGLVISVCVGRTGFDLGQWWCRRWMG